MKISVGGSISTPHKFQTTRWMKTPPLERSKTWCHILCTGRKYGRGTLVLSASNVVKIWCPQAELNSRKSVQRKTIRTVQSASLASVVTLMGTSNRRFQQHGLVHLGHKSNSFWPTYYHSHNLRSLFAKLSWKNRFSLFPLWFLTLYLPYVFYLQFLQRLCSKARAYNFLINSSVVVGILICYVLI